MQTAEQAPQEKKYSLTFKESQVTELLDLIAELPYKKCHAWIDAIVAACNSPEAQVQEQKSSLIHPV
jgi:hypothetical protein